MPTLAYYVSGHGFGHARRSAQAMRAIVAMRPDIQIVVRTSAPAFLFAGIDRVTVSAPARPFDPGAVERGPLCIDPEASIARLAEVLGRRDEIVRDEAAFLREVGARLVVADIPFLAADAAEAAGVPSVAVGNFTWDWIFDAYATPVTRSLVERVRASYLKMDALLQLPLGHDVTCFRRVIPVPLLANRSYKDRAATLAELGLDPADPRPRVLVAMRGGLSAEALLAAATGAPELTLIVQHELAPGAPANLRRVAVSDQAQFTDLVAACDVAVSKLGYGIVSDCIANGVALLFPPRENFPEDEISRRVCPRYLRMSELPAADFERGAWDVHLATLLGQPPAPDRIATDGDRAVACEILGRI